MPFANYQAPTTEVALNSLTLNAKLPTTVPAGNGLLLCVGYVSHTRESVPNTIGTPSGWTMLSNWFANTATYRGRFYIFAKAAAGTEGGTTIPFSLPAGQESNWNSACWQFWNWEGSVANGFNAYVRTRAASPNYPALTPGWGTDDIVWGIACHYGKNAASIPTNWPTGFTIQQTVFNTGGGTNGAVSVTALQELTAASHDPTPAQDFSPSGLGVGGTFAVRPGSAGSDPGGGPPADTEIDVPDREFNFDLRTPQLAIDQFFDIPRKRFNFDLYAPEVEIEVPAPATAPQGVNFSGAWLNRGSDLTGNADSKQVTFSLWFKAASASAGGVDEVIYSADGVSFLIRRRGNNLINVFARNAAGTQILSQDFDTAVVDTNWHHLCGSYNLGAGIAHLYLDDQPATTSANIVDDLIDFTSADHAVGALIGGTARWDGCFADLYLNFGFYVDLSDVNERRKVIKENASASVDLGSDGTAPGWGAPILYFARETANWHQNKGTGGGFIENGTLTDCATNPPDYAVDQAIDVPARSFNFALLAPSLLFDAAFNVPRKRFNFDVRDPVFGGDLLRVVPLKQFNFNTIAPQLRIDNAITVPQKLFNFALLVPEILTPPTLEIEVPLKVFNFQAFAPANIIDTVRDVPLREFNFDLLAPQLLISEDNAINVPLQLFNFQQFAPELEFPIIIEPQLKVFEFHALTPGVIADRFVKGSAAEIDLTPPRELSPEEVRWFVNNFTILRNVLEKGATGTFETTDGKLLVIKNGIVEQILD